MTGGTASSFYWSCLLVMLVLYHYKESSASHCTQVINLFAIRHSTDILNHLPVAALDNQCVCCGSCERTLTVFTFLTRSSQLSSVTEDGVSWRCEVRWVHHQALKASWRSVDGGGLRDVKHQRGFFTFSTIPDLRQAGSHKNPWTGITQ